MVARGNHATGFPPLARRDARLLILGSLPGQRSLDAGQYYAHPRNAFWRLAADLFGIPANADYLSRAAALADRGIALWDVLHSSRRSGSLDARIEMPTAKANDFNHFYTVYKAIELVAFNGRKAAELYQRQVIPSLSGPSPPTSLLPSTSPAYAAMPYSEKRKCWRELTRVIGG